MDARLEHQVTAITDAATSAHADLQKHVVAAQKAFEAKDADAHKAALEGISKLGASVQEKVRNTHAAIMNGAPTSTATAPQSAQAE